MPINQEKRAYDVWEILIQCAKMQKTITYKNLGEKTNIHHRALRHPLDLIQNYCLDEKLPPLTILVVNQFGIPGQGFIAWDIDDAESGVQKVDDYNWDMIVNPFSYAYDNTTDEMLVQGLLKSPENSKKVYAKVNNRGIAQRIFRKALLTAYDNKCAFTGLSYIEGLEAAHIVPWTKSTDEQRLDVRNGILINAFHHKLFDAGFIRINENYEIVCDENQYRSTTEYDKKMIDNICGKVIYLPSNRQHYPLIENIEQANSYH